eukprot:362979-Chlamydomonas_euryale.AAC.4
MHACKKLWITYTACFTHNARGGQRFAIAVSHLQRLDSGPWPNVNSSVLLPQTAAATSSLATSMGQATSTMSSMNVAMDPRKVNSTMAQFSKENMKMGKEPRLLHNNPCCLRTNTHVCTLISVGLALGMPVDAPFSGILSSIVNVYIPLLPLHKLKPILLLRVAEMTSEMMDDAINSAMDDDDLEEEGENVMNQVLEGLGVDLSAAAPNARTNKVAQQQQEQEDEGEMHAFEARLQHLKT